MTGIKTLKRILQLTCLLLTGVRCEKNTAFVYSTLGGEVLLPCFNTRDCSHISWSFYKVGNIQYSHEVTQGQLRMDSDKSGRSALTSNCSLRLRDLTVDDAGSYRCLEQGNTKIDIYLSLLTITSPSTITDLQPGRNLTLNCMLFTYYDAGNCKPYSNAFNLSWVDEDGHALPKDDRYKLTSHSPCSITLMTNLRREDSNRKWRCQVNAQERQGVMFLDITSVFLLESPPVTAVPVHISCPVHLPVSRIVLCVALPVMVFIVGFFTWKTDRKWAKASAAGIELPGR